MSPPPYIPQTLQTPLRLPRRQGPVPALVSPLGWPQRVPGRWEGPGHVAVGRNCPGRGSSCAVSPRSRQDPPGHQHSAGQRGFVRRIRSLALIPGVSYSLPALGSTLLMVSRARDPPGRAGRGSRGGTRPRCATRQGHKPQEPAQALPSYSQRGAAAWPGRAALPRRPLLALC